MTKKTFEETMGMHISLLIPELPESAAAAMQIFGEAMEKDEIMKMDKRIVRVSILQKIDGYAVLRDFAAYLDVDDGKPAFMEIKATRMQSQKKAKHFIIWLDNLEGTAYEGRTDCVSSSIETMYSLFRYNNSVDLSVGMASEEAGYPKVFRKE